MVQKTVCAALAVCLLGIGHLPTLAALFRSWSSEAQNAHGFLVLPASLLILWMARERRPQRKLNAQGILIGVLLLAISSAPWWSSSPQSITLLGVAMTVYVAGAVSVLCGVGTLVWALPAIAFLTFMLPLPNAVEHFAAGTLQSMVTKVSTSMLLFVGVPAVTEGTTILLNSREIQVASVCGGIAIFVGPLALAVAYGLTLRRNWWHQLLVIGAALPVGLFTKSTSVALAGLLDTQAHYLLSVAMLPVAALLLLLAVGYFDRLFPSVQAMDAQEVLRRSSPPNSLIRLRMDQS